VNFASLIKAVDALMAFRDAAKRFNSKETPPVDLTQAPLAAAAGPGGHIEARLTSVVVAALKEAFDRDHTRLELERTHLEEERRRTEAAVQLELRRQAADRELARLRLLAGTALVGWIASVAIAAAGFAAESVLARIVLALAWLLLLGALGAAFTAQGQVGVSQPGDQRGAVAGAAGAASLWLLLAGLAATAISLLL
jgi:hypothetical protein